jgi:hypothetical protein
MREQPELIKTPARQPWRGFLFVRLFLDFFYEPSLVFQLSSGLCRKIEDNPYPYPIDHVLNSRCN